MFTKGKVQIYDDPISAKEILTTIYPEPNTVIPELLPVGLAILAGRPKVGKSWLGLQMAVAVGSGGLFLDKEVVQKPVLYISYEAPASSLQGRLIKQNAPIDNLLIDFYPMKAAQEEFDDLSSGGSEKISQLISKKNYGLVVIDTLSCGIHNDYSDNNKMTKALIPMRQITHHANMAILLIDHHRKPRFNSLTDAINDILGATAKSAIIDTGLGLYKDSREGAKLEMFSRELEPQILPVEFDNETCTWFIRSEISSEAKEKRLSENKLKILEAMKELKSATNAEIAKYLVFDPANCHKILQSLYASEHISKDPLTGKYSIK